jgi:hypothetical protein
MENKNYKARAWDQGQSAHLMACNFFSRFEINGVGIYGWFLWRPGSFAHSVLLFGFFSVKQNYVDARLFVLNLGVSSYLLENIEIIKNAA